MNVEGEKEKETTMKETEREWVRWIGWIDRM